MPERTIAQKLIASVLTGLLAGPSLLLPGVAGAGEVPAPPPPPPPTARRPSLAVVGVPLDESGSAAARLAYMGEQVGRRLGRHQIADLVALLDPDADQQRTDKAEQAAKDYELARKNYDELDLQKAVDRCDKSLAAYEKSDLSVHFDDLAKSWILRIASLIANAENQTAGVELNSLLPVDQRSVFDPNLFAPDFIAQVKQRREEIRAKANLTVDVTARPDSARVFIDGSYRGITPLEVRELAPGDHFLTLIAPGFQLMQKRVRPGVAVAFVETMSPAQRYEILRSFVEQVRADPRGPGRNTAATELARDLGVDQVMVIAVSAKGRDTLNVLGVRIDARDGHELAYLDEAIPNDESRFASAADSFLNRAMGSDLRRTGKAPKVSTGGSFDWKPRHTGYALAAAGALALVSGIAFGLSAKGAVNSFKASTEPQTSTSYDSLESSGRRSALIADISYLVALVAGGSGAYLAVTDRAPASDDGNAGIDEKRTVTHKLREADADEAPRPEPARAPAPKPEPKPEPKKVAPAKKPAVQESAPAKVKPKPAAEEEESPPPPPKKGKKQREDDDLRDD